MPNLENSTHGVETRLKVKQRGFYHDKSPNFAGVKETHEKAKAKAGEKKLAALEGIRSALEKFGFLQGKNGNPVEVVSDLFRFEDFGLPTKDKATKPKNTQRFPTRRFGDKRPYPSAGGASEQSAAYNPDRVMDYTGV